MLPLTPAENELERLDNVIKAAEQWAKIITKSRDTHAKLIKTETRLETMLRRYFRELAQIIPMRAINWQRYEQQLRQIQAADDFIVEVFIEDTLEGLEDSMLFGVTFDPVLDAVYMGALAAEELYDIEIGVSRTSANIQRVARQSIAEMVGKKLDTNGNIVDNPKPEYKITETTRANIRESIRTSLILYEDTQSAIARMRSTINDPRRATMIAQTEAVNAYNRGILLSGQESGAVGKEWQSINTEDICATNAKQGIIKINERFASGHTSPAAHPFCRCGLRLVYPDELLN